MYASMLNIAVKALKADEKIPDLTAPLSITSEINLRVPALLPNAYCPDVHERLTLYKRLANCDTADDLRAMQEELIDRFGEPPAQAQALVETHRLRIAGKNIGIAKLDASPAAIQIQLIPNPPINPANIITLIQTDRAFKLAGPNKLVWTKPTATLKDRVTAITELFRKLRPKA
jgi:transcription-repair coupling factor (superfamily II helicase)